MTKPKRFSLVLLKPSHYDDDGYVILWFRSAIPASSLACFYGLTLEHREDGQSVNTKGLYPAGEGAGYACGILSAGIDGIKAAEAVAMSILRKESSL